MSTEKIRRAEALLGRTIYLSDSTQNRAANLDRAIELLRLAADGFTGDPRSAENWGVTQYELGLAFVSRINGDRRRNLDAAIDHYRHSATTFTLEKHADRFAMVQQNLGSAFSDLVDIDPLDPSHSLNAIEAHRAAMKAHRHRGNPVDWASAANNLAVAYRDALHGPRADQIEKAIQLHEAALGVFTAGAAGFAEAVTLKRPNNPYWSDSMVRLAPNTRISLQQGEEHYTRVNFIRDCARTFAHLAISLGARLRGDAARNIEESINASLTALRLFNELGDVRDQARVANNLGHEFGRRVLGTSFDNLQRSVQHYRMALVLHRQSSLPFEIAQTKQNLGATLQRIAERFPERPAQERSQEMEEAIRLLQSSLRVRTRGDYPFHWAMTSSMVARAYAQRMEGDPGANTEEALRLFDEALDVGELRSGFPIKWLELKTNQGETYFHRVRGGQLTNVVKAAKCYRVAVDASMPPASSKPPSESAPALLTV